MQRAGVGFRAQELNGAKADFEMLGDARLIKGVGHAGEFDLAMERAIGNAEQRAVGNAVAEPVRGDRRRFHVDRDRSALIEAHRDLPALMPFVHLPVQSGNDRVLEAMNRKHTRRDYLAAIDRLRNARADMAFSSDFIVGFPGESESEFLDTLSLVDEVGFASAFSFMYSPRPGTPAAEMDGQIADAEKSERLQRLQAAISRNQKAFNARAERRAFDVLLEKLGRHQGQLVGKTPYLQAAQVMAPPALIGEVVPVAITEVGANSLFGALVGDTATPALDPIGA